MVVRIGKTSEKALETCTKYGLWGEKNSLAKWEIGDQLILYVNKKLAAVAEVTGKAFKDNSPIWEQGIFPSRIPIKFNYILKKDDMIPFDAEIIGTFMDEWGLNYGWGIQSKHPLSKEAGERLIEMIARKSK